MDEENRTNPETEMGPSGDGPISKGVGIVVVIILLLAVGIYLYARATDERETPTPEPVPSEEQMEGLNEIEMLEEDLEGLDFEGIDAELEGEIEMEFETATE